jgi:23S rRNA-/tRNA-specific pseudouridylate synthase
MFGQLSGEKRLPVSVVQCEPKTGRTHQIRVHFNAIHHPVVGDTLYAPNHPYALGFERTALHANWIEFENLSGKKIKIIAPLPDDFSKVVEHFSIKI